MENRKPFNLRDILIVYNLVQTIFSAWIFYEVIPSFEKIMRSITENESFFFVVPNEWMVGQLQLQMSTCRLF